jgi:alkylation response protein AidB-like acyl-CoA dehydrogenase
MDVTRQVSRLDWSALGSGTELGGADLASDLLDAGATLYSAELLGIAQRVLDMSVEYAGVREQFGRPIGSFQAVKHRCADMLVDVELARSLVYSALVTVDHDPGAAETEAAIVGGFVGDAALAVAASNIQVHGGIGFTWEHDAHLYLKRAKSSQLLFATPTAHRRRAARLLEIATP